MMIYVNVPVGSSLRKSVSLFRTKSATVSLQNIKHIALFYCTLCKHILRNTIENNRNSELRLYKRYR